MIIKTINAEKVLCPKQEAEIRLAECKACKKHGGFQNMYSEVICKFQQFEDAPEVREIAKDLINTHHSHLYEAKILFLFRNGTWKVNRKTRYGTAEKCSSKVKFLTGYDFIITINGEIWPYLDQRAKAALVDHELCHCARGDDDNDGTRLGTSNRIRWRILQPSSAGTGFGMRI